MHSLTTIVALIAPADIPEVERLIDTLGNPAVPAVREALDQIDANGCGTHFMSLHAVRGTDGSRGHLLLEFTADSEERPAIDRIVAAIGDQLAPIFAKASDWRAAQNLSDYLYAHRIDVGSGLFNMPGLCFVGTPGMTVQRIRDEAALARFVGPLIDDGRPDIRPIDRLASIRRKVEAQPEFAWALEPGLPPEREKLDKPVPALVLELALPFIRTYLWPAILVTLAGFAIAWVMTASLWWAIKFLAVEIVAILLVLGTIYLALRRAEASDWVDDRAPDAATLREIGTRENFCAQDHMISITERKPGAVRWLTLRLVFWLIVQLATRVYRPGFLGDISTIHAARWVTLPGTRTLVFLSNYGGSWESYLEDFITRAHAGLTAVWSNSIGFPRAWNLFQGGATDGERFKRYARASMQPTRFWYSAYPDLVTNHVRCNAVMRRGLAAALTEEEAEQWLALFGSAPRPDAKLETSEIQSLLFGGLGFMRDGACLFYRLPGDTALARAWLATVYKHSAFGDGRKLRAPAVVTVGLGAGALAKLGLPDECTHGFPAAFLEGMANETRARILGDNGDNAPQNWEWGREAADVVLLAYGYNGGAVSWLEKELADAAAANQVELLNRVALVETKKPAIEPFGFVDGVSQPIIRGSYQSYRNNDPIHLVEPGEFIIGYPDNRGNFPPEPELSPLADPENRLPIAAKSNEFGTSIVEAPRAVARNGSFLVIRQLEQDVEGFHRYCEDQADRIKDRLPVPYQVTPDYIGAKLVGRWPDGSSLVRNPYYAFPDEQKARALRRSQRPTVANFSEQSAVAAAGEPVGDETLRPETKPKDSKAIAPPAEPSQRGDNDFLYGVEDPQALRCPFGAHIRRANPRDSLSPGSSDQVAISNRHRILRVGRLYEPAQGRNPGLLFMCLNSDIERQFEFVQQTWLVSPAFHGLVGEQDPLTSDGRETATGYLIPSNDGPVRLSPLPRFVKTLGGGYFFLPSRSLLRHLGDI